MADGKIKISELNEALQIDDNAQVPYSQDNGGVQTTFKGPVSQIARKIAEGITYTNLKTTNKTLVGSINQTLNNFAEEYDTTQTYNSGDPVLYAGVLYKCNSNNVTGAWDSTKWDEAKAVEFGGGGGSGGHTILDDEGTSLTQRDDLQFKGAYSEDDSTNDKTVVNVARTMTLAEFEQLTDDEKAGFINVKDETSESDDKFQPVIYSEEEREIGVWINGKPLYQKTLVIAGTSLTAGQSNVIQHGISDIDYIQLVSGTYTFGDGEAKLPLPFADNYKPVTESVVVIEAISSSSIRIGVGSNYQGAVSPNTVWITVQYTKTTDTPGSGQWTPQGVPAVHYSEDEQVVGTWIDGSTLYERTLTTPTTSTTTESGISNVFSLSGVENVEIVGGYVYIGTATLPLNFVMYEVNYSVFTFYDIANAQIANNVIGWTPTAFNIRVRYTKTST